MPSVDLLICARYYSDKAGDIIAPLELPYSKEQPDVILDGTSVLQNSINEHRNLFGEFIYAYVYYLVLQEALIWFAWYTV